MDVEKIREDARKHMSDGPVTQTYGADRETVLKLLNDSLATEIVCMLRYKRHHFMAKGIHSEAVAAEFAEHATEEQEHADRFAERIVQLGGEPDFAPDSLKSRSHSEYKEGTDLTDMIRENLIAERIADRYVPRDHSAISATRTSPRVVSSRKSWRSKKSTPTTWPTCSKAAMTPQWPHRGSRACGTRCATATSAAWSASFA